MLSIRLSLSILIASVLLKRHTEACRPHEVITLGAAVSQTEKYALNGASTKNGYDLAARKVNEKGGGEIGRRQAL